jgi:hypothetical protein
MRAIGVDQHADCPSHLSSLRRLLGAGHRARGRSGFIRTKGRGACVFADGTRSRRLALSWRQLIGGQILAFFDWRFIFGITTMFGAIAIAASALRLPETHRPKT